MRHLVEVAESLNFGEVLPIGLLSGAGLIHGLLVAEETYVDTAKHSLQESSRGGGLFSGNYGSTYSNVLDLFDAMELGKDPGRETVPLVHTVITTGMISAEVPAMRVNAQQIVSWWVTETKVEGAKFSGGGVGFAF